jgi:uroporphyrinogen-III synthase
MMRVAITRALPEALRSAERVRNHGAEPIVAPLLEIAPRAFDATLAGVQALLITSANGARAAGQALRACALPVLAVGDATAGAAREAGFRDVRSAAGDVQALFVLAKQTLDPGNGALVYLSGADIAADLTGLLCAAGFQAERRIVYEARQVRALPDAYSQALDIIAFHSVRAARAFAAFGAPHAKQRTAACLSQNIADAVEETAQWRRVVVASAPQEEALWRTALGA